MYCGENIFIQEPIYYLYVIVKGIECISNVFITLLLYTKNFNLVYYHCQKAFCYYVEFISQIGNENHSFLKLNAKDAILFVYRKSIFQVDNDFKKKYKSKQSEKAFYSEICDICKRINKMSEIQLSKLDITDNNEKMKKIIMNNSEIFKHIYFKDNLLQILYINDKIINDLQDHFDTQFIFEVINYYNKKVSNTSKETYILNNYNFIFNDSYLNYTPLRIANLLYNIT